MIFFFFFIVIQRFYRPGDFDFSDRYELALSVISILFSNISTAITLLSKPTEQSVLNTNTGLTLSLRYFPNVFIVDYVKKKKKANHGIIRTKGFAKSVARYFNSKINVCEYLNFYRIQVKKKPHRKSSRKCT